jgi:hypothetical protein
MLPIKKIYIDSRHKSNDSVSNSDFKIDLPVNISLPENTAFYITDISVPVSWYTIEAGRNNKLYFRVNAYNVDVITIPDGNYNTVSLNNAIVDLLNLFYPLTSAGTPVEKFTAFPNLSTNTIVIGNTTDNFEIFTDEQVLKEISSNTFYTSLPLNSINTLLQNTTPKINSPSAYFHSGFVDLFPIRNLYIVSQTLGNYNSVSVNGEWSIIKKCPVRAGPAEMLFDQVILPGDYLDCSNQTISRIDIKMKDSYGNLINLHGNHWSFSIVFVKVNE